jgi:UDP-glucose 4-epimerase
VTVDGRRILVTGADGFIGSHLVERLVGDGAAVRAFCQYNSNNSWGWLDELPDDMVDEVDVRLGDVRDPESVASAVDGVEIVLHLAALIAIPYSYEAPASYVDTNIRGTMHVLEACRRSDVNRLVHTSTSEVYGTPHVVPITESHPLQGQSPYSATKIAADKLVEAWVDSFDVPAIVLRPFNTYGPRQSARAVIPTILGQLLAGETEIHLGNVETTRDFTFVLDTVDGFVRAATAHVDPGSVVQLGTGVDVSVRDLVTLAGDTLGVTPSIVVDRQRVRPTRSEVLHLRSDPTRAREVLGWHARTELRDGLRETAAWLESRVTRRHARRYQR